ncbi:GDSL esterase/lipase [Quillaja saponaria]|uniref:GDSL esterase/lipase n=1 Tax=Quillaja saponaria TaxID=32244 RepID=A0AAD7KUS5_QUISA|nr:GDSL esterase/lipase [Quillaja saponaria]
MMNSKFLFLHVAIFIAILSFTPTSAHNKSRKSIAPSAPTSSQADYKGSFSAQVNFKGSFSKVYAFGDSYTDTGNAYHLGALKTFVKGIITHNSTNNLPGYRLSNGRLVIDYLCDALALPPLTPFKDLSTNSSAGVNFAIAGSTALSSDFFINHKIAHSLMWKAIPESFQTQIDWFHKFIQDTECKGTSLSECKIDFDNSLFWIGEMGGNDYARLYGSTVAVRFLTELAVNHVCKLVTTMLETGAKYIVVQGLPPAGCLPLNLALHPLHDRDAMGCSASANAIIQAHNELLQKKLDEIRRQFSGCMIVYADYWGAFHKILSNLKQFHFEEPFKACCGAGEGPFNFDLHCLCGATGSSTCADPSKFISWDGIHLTEAMHRHLAELLFNQGYCKPSFQDLIKMKTGT